MKNVVSGMKHLFILLLSLLLVSACVAKSETATKNETTNAGSEFVRLLLSWQDLPVGFGWKMENNTYYYNENINSTTGLIEGYEIFYRSLDNTRKMSQYLDIYRREKIVEFINNVTVPEVENATIEQLEDPLIGERSMALKATATKWAGFQMYSIKFMKGNVSNSIIISGYNMTDIDFEILKYVARKAETKIK